jgi:DNA-binding IclR family transcriptional regulator
VPDHLLHSVAKALEVLLLLKERDQIGVAEAGRELGVTRSTAHRLVTTLEHYGFTQRDQKGQYRLGTVLISLGMAAVVRLDIRRRARKHMEQLAQEVGETVTLMMSEGGSVRFLDCVESPHPIRVAGRSGLVRPAHCTSAGKAILAELPPEQFERRYPAEELDVLTEDSIATRSELVTELRKIRRQGYATNLGESDKGLRAVGVAIPELAGPPVAGLGVSAPANRMTRADIKRVAAAAKRTATAISVTFDGLSD